MSFRFSPPANEIDFELFCLRLLRRLWSCPNLERYGTRGGAQDGIDLIDTSGGSPFRAVQCKHHEGHKTIPPAEILAEVEKAIGSEFLLDEYYVLTTARKSAQTQKALLALNRDAPPGRFKVYLWAWEDIEARLSEIDDLGRDFVICGDSGRSASALTSVFTGVLTTHFDRTLYSSEDANDASLKSAEEAIGRYELEVASAKLTDIELHAADKLQPRQWYQLKALRCRLHCARWEWREAGRLLLDAKRHLPETERARINEALGRELVGDREAAHALATALRAEFPHSVRLATIWVRTAPVEVPFDSMAAAAAPFVQDDEELNLAMAHQALAHRSFDAAVPYARRATVLDPDSPQAWLVLGETAHATGYQPGPGGLAARLEDAKRHYDRAVELSKVQKLPSLEANARFNRAKVLHLLGDNRSEYDFRRAVDLARPDQRLRTQYAGFLLELNRPADALCELEAERGEPTADALYFKAAALYARNQAGDRGEAGRLLREVLERGGTDRRDDSYVLLVQWAVEAKSQQAARSLIDGGDLKAANPLVYHMLAGWLTFSEGDTDGAKAEYLKAHAAAWGTTNLSHLDLLTQGLTCVGEDALAVPLLERFRRPCVFDEACKRLLDAARRLRRHDLLVRVCRELREAGATDPRLIQTELATLQTDDPDEALCVAGEYLNAHPQDRHVTLWQSTLALRLGRRELVVSDLARLPPLGELTPAGSGLVLRVLDATGPPAATLNYAYDALRAHFDEEFAHGQYIAYFLKLSPHCPELRVEGVAALGAAVSYREGAESAERWAVLEDGPDPDLGRGEFPPEHAVSRAFAGRRVGDTVTLSDSGVQARTAVICTVSHKHVYRFQDCCGQYQILFPGGSAIQVVHFGTGDQFDPSLILKTLEDRRKHMEWLNGVYRSQGMPFATYAELCGRDEYEAWVHLVSDPTLGIRSGDGSGLAAGVSASRNYPTLVLDLTALLTLDRLGLLDLLRLRPGRCVVSRSTFERVERLAELAVQHANQGGSTALAEGGRLTLIESSLDERRRQADARAALRDAVRDFCQILPCPQAAALDPKRRDEVVDALGRHNLHSMLLASAAGAALWTDDFVLGVFARTDFQAGRVGTQAVLAALVADGAMSQGDYDRAVAKLVGWHYQGAEFNERTLVAAAEVASWRMDAWPARQVLHALRNPAAVRGDRVRIVGQAVRAVWRRDLTSEERQAFLYAALSALGSTSLVRALIGRLPSLFPLNFASGDEVRRCIIVWLETTKQTLDS